MKKIYFLMLMLMMSVSGVMAQNWEDQGDLKISPALEGGEFASGTVFYTISQKGNGGTISVTSLNGGYAALSSTSSDDNARWAIIGNNTDGFQFVNKATKKYINSEKAADANRSSNVNATTFVTEDGTLFDIAKSIKTSSESYQHYVVKIHTDGNHYWNKQNNKLAVWNSAEGYTGWNNSGNGDDGSKFRFVEVESYVLNNFAIVLPDGVSISYDGNTYNNGDVLSMTGNPSVDAITVSPAAPEGKKYVIKVDATAQTITVTLVNLPITSLDQVEAGHLYTLTSVDRGSFVYASEYSEANLSGSVRAGVTFDATSENFQFAFVEDEGKTYLWSRGAGKFVEYANPNVTLTDAVPAAGLSLLASTGTEKAEFPTVLAIDGSHQINMSTDQQQGLLTTWNSTSDKGNMLAIVDIDATLTAEELAAIDAILHPTSFTYTVTSNKSEGGVIYDETPYTAGSEIADLSEAIEVEDLAAIEIEGLEAHISMDGYTISVYYLPTAADLTGLAVKSVGEKTQTIETGKWYTLTQVRGAGETPAYNNEGAIYRAAADQTVPVVFAEGTEATEVAEYLIRFVPGDFEGSYYMQFGDGSFWGAKESGNAELKAYTDFAENYLVYGVDGTEGIGINQTNNGTTFGRILDNNGADATVAYWDNGKVTTTGNNLWFIYPVELDAPAPEVEFTVAYDGDETITITPQDPEATYFWGIANDAIMGLQSFTNVYDFYDHYLCEGFWEEDMCTGEITMTDTYYRSTWQYGLTEGLNYILVANGYWDAHADVCAVRTGDIEVYEITYGEPTGVGTVLRSEVTSKLTFNLQGQRLNKVQRGINIINNKKVLVK